VTYFFAYPEAQKKVEMHPGSHRPARSGTPTTTAAGACRSRPASPRRANTCPRRGGGPGQRLPVLHEGRLVHQENHAVPHLEPHALKPCLPRAPNANPSSAGNGHHVSSTQERPVQHRETGREMSQAAYRGAGTAFTCPWNNPPRATTMTSRRAAPSPTKHASIPQHRDLAQRMAIGRQVPRRAGPSNRQARSTRRHSAALTGLHRRCVLFTSTIFEAAASASGHAAA
jgi:hypothetical protein